DKYVELYPNGGLANMKRGNAYYAKGDYDRAILDYSQSMAVSRSGIGTSSLVQRGNAYNAKGDFEHALADLNAAGGQQPDAAYIYFNRGNFYLGRKDYSHAVDDYDQAIKFGRRYPAALYNRGLAKKGLGDTAGGDADIVQAKSLDPSVDQ